MKLAKSTVNSFGIVLGVLLGLSCMSSLPWLLIAGYALFNPPQTTPWAESGPMPHHDGTWQRFVHEEGSYPAIRKVVSWRHNGQMVNPGERATDLARNALSSTHRWMREREKYTPGDGRPSFSRPVFSQLLFMVSLDPDLAVITLRTNSTNGTDFAFADWLYREGNSKNVSLLQLPARLRIGCYAGAMAPRGEHVLVVSGQEVLLDLSDAQPGKNIHLVESGVDFLFSVSTSTIQVQRQKTTEAN